MAATGQPISAVSAVVVSYNSAGILGRCLGALTREGVEHVVVVDNASVDESVRVAEAELPRSRVLALERNAGFGGAANVGVRATGGSHVLLCNPDAWPEPGGLRALLAHAVRDPRVALVGPQLLAADGRPQRSVIRHPSGRLTLGLAVALPGLVSHGYALVRRSRGGGGIRDVRRHEFVMAAAVLLRRDAFEQVGGFDEDYFMYDEEVDLEARLRQAGWRVGFCPAAVFTHLGAHSTAPVALRMYREQMRSHLRFVAKQQGEREAEAYRRLLARALRVRAATGGGAPAAEASAWLASTSTAELLRRPR